MKKYINNKGFSFIDILIAIVILELLTITSGSILLQINKINIKSSKNYTISKAIQSYMENIKCNHLTIGDKTYSLEELQNKEMHFLESPYEITLKIDNDDHDNFYKVSLKVTDEDDSICTLENYIYTLQKDCYDELSIEENNLIK